MDTSIYREKYNNRKFDIGDMVCLKEDDNSRLVYIITNMFGVSKGDSDEQSVDIIYRTEKIYPIYMQEFSHFYEEDLKIFSVMGEKKHNDMLEDVARSTSEDLLFVNSVISNKKFYQTIKKIRPNTKRNESKLISYVETSKKREMELMKKMTALDLLMDNTNDLKLKKLLAEMDILLLDLNFSIKNSHPKDLIEEIKDNLKRVRSELVKLEYFVEI